jgi:mannosyltransferase OCH1-like enzyme
MAETATSNVPKIIHQTWKTTIVPEQWQSSVEKYRALTAHGFKYILWSDQDNRNLIRDHYPWFLEQYDKYEYGIQRADAIRYFILHRYGGVYSDLDIRPKASFVELYELYKKHPVSLPSTKQGNGFAGHIYSNCFMMSKPGCDFWPCVWQRLQHPFRGKAWKQMLAQFHYWKILFTTGPGVVCDAAAEYKGTIAAIPAALIQPGVEREAPLSQHPEAAVELLRGESWQQKDATFWRGLSDVAPHQTTIAWSLVGALVLALCVCLWFWRRCRRDGTSHVRTERISHAPGKASST